MIAPITNGAAGWLESGRNIIEPGSELSFGLTLIGRAQEYFPYFVVALREIDRLGRRPEYPRPRFSVGEGRERVTDTLQAPPSVVPSEPSASEATRDHREAIPLPPPHPQKTVELRRIDQLDPLSGAAWPVYDAADNLVRPLRKPLTLSECAALPPPASGRLTIDFLTQTRLKHEGGWARVPEFQILFRRLLGRLSSLSRFHCGTPLDVDFRRLIDRAASICLIADDTKWTRWQRYSSRQDRRMEWEGIIGRANYGGDFTPFWRFLAFGQFIHVGHSATFGLGRYRVR